MCKCCPFSGLRRLKEMHELWTLHCEYLFGDVPPDAPAWDDLSPERQQEIEDGAKDWSEAVDMDMTLRRFKNAGVEREVYTNQSLMPLLVLAELEFDVKDPAVQEELTCDSGLCFM